MRISVINADLHTFLVAMQKLKNLSIGNVVSFELKSNKKRRIIKNMASSCSTIFLLL